MTKKLFIVLILQGLLSQGLFCPSVSSLSGSVKLPGDGPAFSGSDELAPQDDGGKGPAPLYGSHEPQIPSGSVRFPGADPAAGVAPEPEDSPLYVKPAGPATLDEHVGELDEISIDIGGFSGYCGCDKKTLQPSVLPSGGWAFPMSTQAIVTGLLDQFLGHRSFIFTGSQFPMLPTKTMTLANRIEQLPEGISFTLSPEVAPAYFSPDDQQPRTVSITQETLKQLTVEPETAPQVLLSPLFFGRPNDFSDMCRLVGEGLPDRRQDKRLLSVDTTDENSFGGYLTLQKGIAKEGSSRYQELDKAITAAGNVNGKTKACLGLGSVGEEKETALDLLSVGSGVAIAEEIVFCVEQYKADDGKAYPKFRKGTIPNDNEKLITMICVPGVNAKYGAEYLRKLSSAAIWFKQFLNMWATILGAAQKRGCRILCAPLISAGAFAPKDSTLEFLTMNFLALGMLLATVYKNDFDRVYLNPRLFVTEAQVAWNLVFGQEVKVSVPRKPLPEQLSPLRQVLSDKGGVLVPFSGDVAFLAMALAKKGYKVAELNPSDADVTFGLRPPGCNTLYLSPNPEDADFVAEEWLAAMSTMILASKGINMSTDPNGGVPLSLYENLAQISLLDSAVFAQVQTIMVAMTPEIASTWFGTGSEATPICADSQPLYDWIIEADPDLKPAVVAPKAEAVVDITEELEVPAPAAPLHAMPIGGQSGDAQEVARLLAKQDAEAAALNTQEAKLDLQASQDAALLAGYDQQPSPIGGLTLPPDPTSPVSTDPGSVGVGSEVFDGAGEFANPVGTDVDLPPAGPAAKKAAGRVAALRGAVQGGAAFATTTRAGALAPMSLKPASPVIPMEGALGVSPIGRVGALPPIGVDVGA